MSQTPEFYYDVFISHSSQDKPTVRAVAERLRADGLKVWLDEWEIKPGDSIPAKIEEGLEHSRVLVFCMSANAFGSDWSQLESYTFRFRDPLNKERRFIPLRLDETPIKGSLAQFLYINWLPAEREHEYVKLLNACSAKINLATEMLTICRQQAEKSVQLEYKTTIFKYVFSPDGKLALTGAADKTMRLWDVETRRCSRLFFCYTGIDVLGIAWSLNQLRALSAANDGIIRLWDIAGSSSCLFAGHKGSINDVAFSADNHYGVSCGEDKTIRLWDLETGNCISILIGHSKSVNTVVWSADQQSILSGSYDNDVRMWDVETARCLRIFKGHTDYISCLAWSNNRNQALSGSEDNTLRLWDVETGNCLRIFEGHTNGIRSLAWSSDQRYILSGANDGTVRLWDVEAGRCQRILKSHTNNVATVAWLADERHAISGDVKGKIILWDLSEFVTEPRTHEIVASTLPTLDQIQYTNAKVLLVGDSGVGKTGLSNFIAHGIMVEDDKPLQSTDGVWATHWPLHHTKTQAGVEREIWLWDFAGQVDYRLVHQLYMDDTAAAVLVFNPQTENPFEGLGLWDRDLGKAARRPFAKLLAAGRVDRGGLLGSAAGMERFMADRGFLSPLHLTSAKTGEGCEQLREAIVQAIDWQSIPETTSPALYHRLKQEILGLRDSGLVLIRLAELKQRMEMTLRGEDFQPAELEAVVSLLSGPGMIQRLDFGGFILLRPEVLSRYAAAVVRKVRKHPQEMGCIREDELLAGELDYQDFRCLPREDEVVVLRTLLETFVSRAWCLRQPCDGTAMLIFPSYFRRERKEQPGHPSVLVTYRFDGSVDDIYATLVVRLHHTLAFDSVALWKSAADFNTQTGAALGFTLARESEGTSRLEVYFAPNVDANSRVLFLRYVHEHLMLHAQNVVRLRHYACGYQKCDSHGQAFTNQAMIDKALAPGGKGKVFCPDCGKPILLRDVIEEKFDSPAVQAQVRKMQSDGQAVIDNESKELILVGHAFAIAGEAGQIFRPTPNSDHGIDGEIEFKDDQGRASGQRLYVQLKSGDSYLKPRRSDDTVIFHIANPRWAEYWQQQAYPVMLVIRTSDGEIRWMDVSAYLKRENASGRAVKQIVFDGERFDMMSVRRWREKVLRQDHL